MGKKGAVPYLVSERGRYKYQRRVPAGLQSTIGLKKWLLSCGEDYGKAVAKVVGLAEEHDALIARLQTPQGRQQYQTAQRRKREAAQADRNLQLDQAQRRRVERLGIRDEELEIEDELNRELGPHTWRYVPAWLDAVERQYLYPDVAAERMIALRSEIEAKGLSGDITQSNEPPMDGDEFHDRLVGLYDAAFGPHTEVPTDPIGRDEFDLLRLKLERKIARVAPAVDTVKAVFERYLDFTSAKPATRRKYREHIGGLIARIGDLPIKHVTPGMIREHRDALAKKLGASSVRASFTPISGLFSYAVDESLIEISPSVGVKLPRDKRVIEEIRWLPFSPEEMITILGKAEEWWLSPTPGLPRERREALEMLVRVLAFTAMRPAEVMALEPADVSERSITIKDGKTKSAWRVIPLHPAVKDFPGWMQAGGMETFKGIETDRVTPLRQNFSKLIRKQLEKPISEPRKALYSLRSTFQNALRRAGAPEDVRRAILGHAEGGALRHYDDGPEFEKKKEWVEKADPRR